MLQRNTFLRMWERSRIWNKLFLNTYVPPYAGGIPEGIRTVSRTVRSHLDAILCEVTCGLTHKGRCASGRICLPSSTWMWSNAVWHVEGLMLRRRLAVLLVLSELIRGRRHDAAQKHSLRFPRCNLFSPSCRLRQTLVIRSASEFNEENQKFSLLQLWPQNSANQTIK